MGNVVSSLIFSARSGDKAINGDSGRTVTCAAQGFNAVESYSKAGMAGSKAAGQAVSYIDNLSKTDTIWGKTAQGLKWTQTHVNPIIGVCAGIKIATADDKEKAFCVEVPGFLGMLLFEGKYKSALKTKPVQKFLANVASKGGKKGKIAAALIEGVTFAATSISGYAIGSKVGEMLIEGDRALAAKKSAKVSYTA